MIGWIKFGELDCVAFHYCPRYFILSPLYLPLRTTPTCDSIESTLVQGTISVNFLPRPDPPREV